MSDHVSVRRYTEDGELDATFGDDGVLLTGVVSADGPTGGVVVDKEDRVVVGGAVAEGDRSQFALARYRDDGTLDASFAESGRVLTRFLTAETTRVAVTTDTAGRIVTAGYVRVGDDTRFVASRYSEDGSLDTGFDWDGAVLTDFFATRGERGHAVVTDDRCRVLVAGRVRLGGTTRLALVRYGAGGWHDSFFDWDSRWLSDIGFGADDLGSAVLTSRTGVVVGGSATMPGGTTQFALAKYRHDGRLDESFGEEGVVVTDFADGAGDRIVGIDDDRRDRIVVAGTDRDREGERGIAVARYTEDGALDTTFDGDGRVRTHLPDASDLRVRCVAVDRCERVVVVGSDAVGSERRFVAVRYNPDGSLDGTFGDGGVVTAARPSRTERVRDVAIDSRGRIVVAGAADAGGRDGSVEGDGLR